MSELLFSGFHQMSFDVLRDVSMYETKEFDLCNEDM